MFRCYCPHVLHYLFTLLVIVALCDHSSTEIIDICNWRQSTKNHSYSDSDYSDFKYIAASEAIVLIIPTLNHKSNLNCSLNLMTCPSCHFELILQLLHSDSEQNLTYCTQCITITEPLFKNIGEQILCTSREGSRETLTQSKIVSIRYSTMNYECDTNFRVIIRVQPNKYEFEENYGYVSTPYFPEMYPNDYSAEYIIRSADKSNRIEILFSDFQLYSPMSSIEIIDTNSSKLTSLSTNIYRPPLIVSSGNNVTIRFKAGNHIIDQLTRIFMDDIGYFRFEYRFVSQNSSIRTLCGGQIDFNGFGGGAIQMRIDNETSKNPKNFDCVWIFKSRPKLKFDDANSFYYLSLKVAKFVPAQNGTYMQIIEGLNSNGKLKANVTNLSMRGEEHIVFANNGFYVRLKGFLSSFLLIYSTFKYGDSCSSVGHFQCSNGRCLRHPLRCDGIDHCGDASDELKCAYIRSTDFSSYFYYTSPTIHSPTNYLIISMTIVGLGMFIATTSLILGKLFRQQNTVYLRSDIREVTEGNLLVGNEISTDCPPSYLDAVKACPPPPAYELISSPLTSATNRTASKVQICSCNGACSCPHSSQRSPKVSSKCSQVDVSVKQNFPSGRHYFQSSSSDQLRRTNSCGTEASFHDSRSESLFVAKFNSLFKHKNIEKKWKSTEII